MKNLDIYQLKMVFSFMRSIFLIKTWIIKKKTLFQTRPPVYSMSDTFSKFFIYDLYSDNSNDK